MRSLLTNYFRAAFPGIAIQTGDEKRACADVLAAAKVAEKSVYTWSATEGLVTNGRQIPDTNDLTGCCSQRQKNAVFILRDPQTWPFERDPILLRAFRDFVESAQEQASTVVIVASQFRPHPCMEKLVVVIDADLPSEAELIEIIDGLRDENDIKDPVGADVIRALGGLTAAEALNALSLSYIETEGFSADVIFREKTKAVKRSGTMEIVAPDPRGLSAVGGLDNLKAWIERRSRVWTPEAKAFGLRDPKGVLLVGVPGTGKSLAAKAIGTALKVPTIRLDIGACFNSLVGESERIIRESLAMAEAMSPCVLWVDEIDKGLSGSAGTGAGDSGVGRRVFGTIISWMQDRKRPVFLVATANQVEDLPPELLRKGRFDEIFTVDLPNANEREAIFRLHMQARGGGELGTVDFGALAAGTENFTGSEIEAVVDEGMFLMFDAGAKWAPGVLEGFMLQAARETVPLFKTAAEKVQAIRTWGETRARPASKPMDKPAAAKGRALK